MSLLHKYVDAILVHVEANARHREDLKQDLYEEIQKHQQEQMNLGLSEEAALRKAIHDFGNPRKVGKQLSKSTVPFRTLSLWSLLIISVVYITSLTIFILSQALFVPYFMISFLGLLGMIIVCFERRRYYIARFRLFFLFTCLLYLLPWGYSQFYLDSLVETPFYWIAVSLSVLFLLSIIANMILGAVYQPIGKQFSKQSVKKRVLLISFHTISGFFVLSNAGIIAFGFMIFGTGTIHDLYYTLPAIIVTIVWLFSLILSNQLPRLSWLSMLINAALTAFLIISYVTV
ncbi:permease prefix domain 1-containing protein [Alkalihalobacillus sp. LMS6]|uniref:permease prefix domain 1-containing protein n=1 Tax=Alkalihalobacillus sp. LMS6 TaxID=2924034 RepID=UPI0020D1A3B2|nr:permease prefix domain 1-containing protein [Alkalihalobacillus sp. LMS6]UTR07048.1 permease prefix domain 1-containing protein [Alkalihalobacillus sp. LMS6]